LKTKWSKIRF